MTVQVLEVTAVAADLQKEANKDDLEHLERVFEFFIICHRNSLAPWFL